MDFISYRGLPMQIIRTVRVERTHVTDPEADTTYLYTLWRGTFIVTYAPGAVNFKAGNPPTTNGRGAQGSLPVVTDNAIRQYLSQPRGQLIIQSLGRTVVTSPANVNGRAMSCDARNGPFVRVGSVVEIPGERLWQIELQFETAVIENPTPSVIISNRWSAEAAVNWQHLCTRVYAGSVTVRSDFLLNSAPNVAGAPFGITPGSLDTLRNAFCAFSLPNTFQRQEVDVRVEPDGLTAHYRVVDAEQLWNKNQNCPAIRVELQESSWRWSPRHFAVRFGIMMAQGRPVDAFVQNLPKYYRRVHVRVWGNGRTNRNTLLTTGIGLCVGRVGSTNEFDPSLDEFLVAQDLNNSVDVMFTRAWDNPSLGVFGAVQGAISAWLTGGAAAPPGDQQFQRGLYLDPTLIGDGVGNALTGPGRAPQTANPPFPGSNGTRGTYLGTLVTQILEGFNAAPGSPP